MNAWLEPLRVLMLRSQTPRHEAPLLEYLETIPRLTIDSGQNTGLPADFLEYDLVMAMDAGSLSSEDAEGLVDFAHQGGGVLAFISPASNGISPVFGVQPGEPGPHSEIRVAVTDPQHPVTRRLKSEMFVTDTYQPLQPLNGGMNTLLHTIWHFEKQPLAMWRDVGEGRLAVTTLQGFDAVDYQRMLFRLLVDLTRPPAEEKVLRAAVIGYGPEGSAGYRHCVSLNETMGFDFVAVCDLSPARRELAEQDFPGISTYPTSDDLAADPDIDLVVVVTPPNTHSPITIQMLEAGKHVVVEKPMAVSYAETQAMLKAAEDNQRLLTTYQNRRWDPDYLAIKQALEDGLIGDLFHIETFVGSYEHACDYWHSHRPASGGALFDWGAHHLDWILQLIPDKTAGVSGTMHKRVWLDVTNADQVRAVIRFEGGQEADFIFSEIAALRKPKWYLLGTEGAIIGEWQAIDVHEVDPVYYFHQHEIPVTEKPPKLTLRRRHPNGIWYEQALPLPPMPRHPYYETLADTFLTGEPLAVTPESTARVVAVMEAANNSADKGGTLEELHV